MADEEKKDPIDEPMDEPKEQAAKSGAKIGILAWIIMVVVIAVMAGSGFVLGRLVAGSSSPKLKIRMGIKGCQFGVMAARVNVIN